MKQQTFKEAVENKIKQSSSLIAALESVAAMYGIPAENIIVDDRLNSIQVQGDTILAPDRPNPGQNTQSIVCAIGAVLDYISQRIDKKLDAFQADQIAKNQQQQPVVPAPSPADVPIEPDVSATATYFTDEDDVMQNVPSTQNIQQALAKAETNIPKQINESALMVDLVDRFHGTTTLGYDLLQHQGFDFVQPTNKFIQEADEDASNSSKKQIQHMKFDNSKILESVKLFNDAYESTLDPNRADDIPIETRVIKHGDGQVTVKSEPAKQFGDVFVKRMMNTPEWKMAVKRLEEQFDCRLYITSSPEKKDNLGTNMDLNQKREKLIISKSKGFQLSHMRINIEITGRNMDLYIRQRDKKLFGQSFVSDCLHEIFHNIVLMLRAYDYDFITSMSTTMMMCSSTSSVKARRAIISNYTKAVRSIDGKKLNTFERKRMIKQLLYLSALQYDKNQLTALKKEIDSGNATNDAINKYIAAMEKAVKKEKKRRDMRDKPFVKGLTKVLTIIAYLSIFVGVGLILVPILEFSPLKGISTSEYEALLKKYLANPDKEEYYCDLFAGIYNLPMTFLLGTPGVITGKTASRIDNERLKKLASLEKEVSQMIFSDYPTREERCYASVRIAKNALEANPDMDPALKEYLEWVIDNYKNLEDIGIKEDYNAGAFNPQEAEDLDAHIQRIIDHGDVNITESAKPFLSKRNRFIT